MHSTTLTWNFEVSIGMWGDNGDKLRGALIDKFGSDAVVELKDWAWTKPKPEDNNTYLLK